MSPFDLGIDHAQYALAYLAGVAAVLIAIACWTLAAYFLLRHAANLLRPRLDARRNRPS